MNLNNITTTTQCDAEIAQREAYLQSGNVPAFIIQTIQNEINDLKAHRSRLSGPVSIYDTLKRTIGYSQPLQDCIEDTFRNLTDPNVEDSSIPGLLLGRIQSGKTRAFVGVMAKAFDNGFDACVVLTKPDNGLVMQTKARMENDFADFLDTNNIYNENVVVVYEVENKKLDLSPLQCSYKNIFVLHKNQRLEGMKKTLDAYYENKKVLIIDDEADFVSRTYYVKQKQVVGGVTGFRIDDLSNNPLVDCYYLQVTATPYSLLLQPNETVDVENGVLSCFHPRFTILVPTHDQYIGGEHYYIKSLNPKSMYSYLMHPMSEDCLDRFLTKNANSAITKKAATHPYFKDLRDALMSYFVGSALRRIQERSNRINYKTSFLIHCATEKGDHHYEKKIVDIILTAWHKNVLQKQTSLLSQDFQKVYDDMQASNNAGNTCIDPQTNKPELDNLPMPSKNDVWDEFLKIFNNRWYSVQCINGDTSDDPNIYEKDGQLKLPSYLNIFIGGYKADRGITINNMIAFLYGRRPQNGGSANTILQHMRQYGNRSVADMSVTRFHTTNQLYQKLKDIYETDENLRNFFKNNTTPSVTYIEYDPTAASYKLCSPQQTRMSSLRSYGALARLIATPGFQTGDAQSISTTINQIDAELKGRGQERVPFLMNKNDAYRLLTLIKSTFQYSKALKNLALEWDEKSMIAAIEKHGHIDGQLWAYYVTNRDLARMRQSGRYADAPEDGKTDTPIAERTATDRPFLMFIRENGTKANGWNGTPFYWPVLRLPQNTQPNIFCDGAVNGGIKKNLVVKKQDGTRINALGTEKIVIACILLAVPQKVQGLNINYRKNNLVFSAGRCPKNYATIVPGKYYLRKGITTIQAIDFLTKISNQLNLGWTITTEQQ